MKNLKSILFSLMAIAMLTVFLTSCEQDNVLSQEIPDEVQETMKKIAQDADVAAFFNASLEFDKAFGDRDEINQEQFDEISGLSEKLNNLTSILSAKYPQLDEIDQDAVEKFNLNNPQLSENLSKKFESSELLESRCSGSFWNRIQYSWCMSGCTSLITIGNNSSYFRCANNCYWRYCFWF